MMDAGSGADGSWMGMGSAEGLERGGMGRGGRL